MECEGSSSVSFELWWYFPLFSWKRNFISQLASSRYILFLELITWMAETEKKAPPKVGDVLNELLECVAQAKDKEFSDDYLRKVRARLPPLINSSFDLEHSRHSYCLIFSERFGNQECSALDERFNQKNTIGILFHRHRNAPSNHIQVITLHSRTKSKNYSCRISRHHFWTVVSVSGYILILKNHFFLGVNLEAYRLFFKDTVDLLHGMTLFFHSFYSN